MSFHADLSIDASVLAMPPENCGDSEVYQYAASISKLGKIINFSWISPSVSKDALDFLANPSDRFPLVRENLERLFERHGVSEFTSHDVMLAAQAIVDKSAKFDCLYKINYMLLSQIYLDPDITIVASGNDHASDLRQLIFSIAVLRKNFQTNAKDHILMIHNAPSLSVSVKAIIEDADHQRDDIPEFSNLPTFLGSDVPICSNLTEFFGCLSEEKILSAATDCFGIWLAICVAAHKRKGDKVDVDNWNILPTAIGRVAIGAEFSEHCQSLIQSGDDAIPGKIIDVILAIVSGNAPRSHGLLEKGKGSSIIRQRKFCALRVDIDSSRRIHYWKGPCEAIELAAVVEHDTTDIPDLSKF